MMVNSTLTDTPSSDQRLSTTENESGQLTAPLREQIAVAIDPLSFALDYETRHKHCSPWKIEYAQQKWFERADHVIALLVKLGILPAVQNLPLDQDARDMSEAERKRMEASTKQIDDEAKAIFAESHEATP